MPKTFVANKHQKRFQYIKPKEVIASSHCPLDKENNLTSATAHQEPLLNYEIEVKEEILDTDFVQFEECIKKEEYSPQFPDVNTQDLNILIEWALNLQFDHSLSCTGRLYPCKEIFDSFNCKIVVLYCTVCKKKMLHTLKDWTTL